MRRRGLWPAPFLGGLVLVVLGGASGLARAQSSAVTLVARDSGIETNVPGGRSISADGRFVVIESTAPDLVSGQIDMNAGASDVFLVDRQSGAVTLVSHVPGALSTTGNGRSHAPRISADGAYVAFLSQAARRTCSCTSGRRAR
jgi:Tol biopolymer transport system component